MIVLYVLAFTLGAGNGAVFALLPQIQDAHDLPTWSLGLVVASAFGAALVSQLALARYADRGWTRPLLFGGVVLGAAGFLLTGFGQSFLSIAGGRAVAGLGVGMALPASRRLLVVRSPDAVGETLGRFLAADITGFVLGAPIAAAIAEVSTVSTAFVMLAGAVLACGPGVVRLAPEPKAAAAALPTSAVDRAVLRRLLRRRPLRAGLALGTATFWAIGVFDTIWARYLTDLGASSLAVGLTLTCFGVPMALLAGWGGRLADRVGPLRVGLVGVVVTVPAMVLYGQFTVLYVLTAIAVVHSMLDGVNMPATQAAVAQHCEPHELASGQGLLSATQMSTAAVASLVVAPLYGAFGGGATFAVAGVAMFLAWLAALSQSGGPSSRALPEVEPARAKLS